MPISCGLGAILGLTSFPWNSSRNVAMRSLASTTSLGPCSEYQIKESQYFDSNIAPSPFSQILASSMTNIFDGDLSMDAQAGSVLTATPPGSPNRRASEFYQDIMGGSHCVVESSLPPLVPVQHSKPSISVDIFKVTQPCTNPAKHGVGTNPDNYASRPDSSHPNHAERWGFPFSDYPAEVKTVRLVPPYVSSQPCNLAPETASSPNRTTILFAGQHPHGLQGLGISLRGHQDSTLLNSFACGPGRPLQETHGYVSSSEWPQARSPNSTIKLVPRSRIYSSSNDDDFLGKFGFESTLDSVDFRNDTSAAISVSDSFSFKTSMLSLNPVRPICVVPPLDYPPNKRISLDRQKRNDTNTNDSPKRRLAQMLVSEVPCSSPASSAKLSPETRKMMDNIRRTKQRISQNLATSPREATL